MSRVGKKPITIPTGVQVKVEEAGVRVKGPKGELARSPETGIGVKIENGQIVVSRQSDDRIQRAKHGLVRSDLNNM
ncbi:MAG: 50S ribosomal protein L6, partial [Nitrospirae bacterium]|nr:50S ribosomal protein L6 [Nitrospirota bacterium]